MGLDMYLTAHRYISDVDVADVQLGKQIQSALNLTKHRVKGIRIDAMYWRKANAIHGWFVENVQGGEDNCMQYPVSRHDLEQLLTICRMILADRKLAEEYLPVTEGFFFGSYDYDDWYFKDLEETEAALVSILEEFDEQYWFTYQSSW